MPRNAYTSQHDTPVSGGLWDIRPAARTVDPETSKDSARALKRSGKQAAQCAEVLAALREYIETWGDSPTCVELANGDAALVHIFGRRLPDLREAGRVVNAGKRQCRITGRQAMTWELWR